VEIAKSSHLKTIETDVAMGLNASDCSLVVETNHKMIGAFKRF